jgi:hypothetical protein
LFDVVVIVDWSASSTPSPQRPAKDAIWIGIARKDSVATTYYRTRSLAEAYITSVLDRTQGQRVLLGFDFPLGYPAGFAQRLTGHATAPAIWDWLAQHISDGADNSNNRFEVAAAINRRVGGPGPFWGRPAAREIGDLPASKAIDYTALGLAERRAVERGVRSAQPVWKLFTTGSVGSQSLMGMPAIHRLALRDDTTVWPFQTHRAPVTIAEIYPSLLAKAVARDGAAIKDEAQVRLLAQSLFALSQTGQIAPLFDAPAIAREEGWILGAGYAGLMEAALSWA